MWFELSLPPVSFSSQTPPQSTTILPQPSSAITPTPKTQYGLIDNDSKAPNRTSVAEESDFQDGPECSAVECYRKWDPVCDNRNQTHRNECLFQFRLCKLKKDGVVNELPEILHKGECNTSQQPSTRTQQHEKSIRPLLAREGFCRVCDFQGRSKMKV